MLINYASHIYDFLRYCYYRVYVNCSVIDSISTGSPMIHVIMSLKYHTG